MGSNTSASRVSSLLESSSLSPSMDQPPDDQMATDGEPTSSGSRSNFYYNLGSSPRRTATRRSPRLATRSSTSTDSNDQSQGGQNSRRYGSSSSRTRSGQTGAGAFVLDPDSESDSEAETDLTTILNYLIQSRGGMHSLFSDTFDGFEEEFDEEDSDYNPSLDLAHGRKCRSLMPTDNPPDTSVLDKSDLKQRILLQTGMLGIKWSAPAPKASQSDPIEESSKQSAATTPIIEQSSDAYQSPTSSSSFKLNEASNSNSSSTTESCTYRVQPQMPSLFSVLRNREIGQPLVMGRYHPGGKSVFPSFTPGDRRRIASNLIPWRVRQLAQYQSKAFCGFFSESGDIFMSASQDCNIRIYDTQRERFRLMKTIWARDVGWSILDTAISPDGRNFIYSSWSESVHICNVYGEHEMHEALQLLPDDRRFCIFSLRFSSDGKEILCGANDECIYCYDCENKRRVLKIRSHEDDVNTVAFADSTSQILFSGGDDGFCKVWDRRTLSEENPKPVGVLAGHIDGITYIDPKGDGRHLITNSKDQTIKLWDMRSFSSKEAQDAVRKAVGRQSWDYRWQAVPRKLYVKSTKVDGDTSLMTYRGHNVLQTLIRARFSPEFTTGQRYIYTGCASGRIIVYEILTGKRVKVLSGHKGCVRDVSWHPYNPQMISTSWDGTLNEWTYFNDSSLTSDDDMEWDAHGRQLRRSVRLKKKRERMLGSGDCPQSHSD